jgi:hypothetical protein
MRHVLAPTGEDPVGKGVIEGDRVMVAEADIDSASTFLICWSKRPKPGVASESDGCTMIIGLKRRMEEIHVSA